MESDFNSDFYNKNLALLETKNGWASTRVQWMTFTNDLHFCRTQKGEPNLLKKRFGLADYYHAPSGAIEEARELIPSRINDSEAVCVFGLGLGYLYDALLPWLKNNPQKKIIFLEDDLEVIRAFLHTERASRLLSDGQAALFYFHEYLQDYDKFCMLFSGLINKRIEFITLPLYAQRREEDALTLCYHTLHDTNLMTSLHNEYLSGQSAFLTNFYNNLLYLPQSYLGSGLFYEFENIPAIICGAGPSLGKNINLLKTLTDKALIFAGGSSLNALNQAGLLPHFGLGVDPNQEQYHRLLTNHTFHLPYLYRPRIAHNAFQIMQGPKLYISGSNNRLSHWFESQLGMPEETIDEGHNVVNLCTEVAYRMGCRPIIYVGMDLAYTEVQPYADGIKIHPLWIHLSRPYSTDQKMGVNRKDIYGNPVKTKWDWISEATWLGQFARHHPEAPLINATEGGLGFPNVPNISLAEVADTHLKKSYDFDGWVHRQIQTHPSPVKQREVITLANTFKTSLETCLACCENILNEKSEAIPTNPEFFTPNTILNETNLQQEIAYQYFLKMFDQDFQYLQEASKMAGNQNSPDYFQHLESFRFLTFVLRQHLDIMQQAIQHYIFSPPPIALKSRIPEEKNPAEIYLCSEGKLQIKDEELDIAIHIPFQAEKEAAYYPNGALKNEMHTWDGKLHGPSRFHNQEGRLLAETWYLHGKKEGKSRQYYHNGALYSLLRYKEGKKSGRQEFFYPNGITHVKMDYTEGWLDGAVQIFAINGQLIRELHYKQGERHGSEKQWRPDGILQKEVTIHRFPDDFDLSLWTSQGELVQNFERGIENFQKVYQDTQKKVDELENALLKMVQQIDPAIEKHLEQNLQQDNLAAEFASIKEAMQQMQHFKAQLAETMEYNLKKAEEAKQKRVEGS